MIGTTKDPKLSRRSFLSCSFILKRSLHIPAAPLLLSWTVLLNGLQTKKQLSQMPADTGASGRWAKKRSEVGRSSPMAASAQGPKLGWLPWHLQPSRERPGKSCHSRASGPCRWLGHLWFTKDLARSKPQSLWL